MVHSAWSHPEKQSWDNVHAVVDLFYIGHGGGILFYIDIGVLYPVFSKKVLRPFTVGAPYRPVDGNFVAHTISLFFSISTVGGWGFIP